MSTDEMPSHWYDAYERGRPGYPEAVVDLADVAPTSTVLDLAAGTGKLTHQLASRFDRVIAVEPDAGMRRVLAEKCPNTKSVSGSADRLPVAHNSIDAVFVAQAFHWFDNEATLAEFARVLRTGGTVVVAWNVAAGEVAPEIAAVEELLAPIWPEDFGFPLDMMRGDWRPGSWQLPFARAMFSDIRTVRLANPQIVDRDDLVAFFGSMGWIANLPDQQRLPLLEAIRAMLASDSYSLPWETCVEWTQRRNR